MRPFFCSDDDGITIYHGDNLEVLAQLERESVDLVVTSPPFNANMEYEQGLWSSLLEYRRWLCERFIALWNVCSSGAWVVCELQDLHVSPEHSHAMPGQKEQFNMATSAYLTVALVEAGWYYKGSVIWNRGRWVNDMAGKMACAPGSPALLVQHSNVLFFRKPGGRKGVYQHPEQSKAWKAKWCRSVWDDVQPAHDPIHPAVMPELMASSIIQGWSLPGQTVLDHFMGRGTTLAAAQKCGRKAIGIDTMLKYCETAALRLSQKILLTEVPVVSMES